MSTRSPLLIAAAVASVGFLAACVSQEPEWTRERQASVTRHSFNGYSSSQIVKAAETVIRLSDPGKADFVYVGDGFSAKRDGSFYFVIGAQTGFYQFDAKARGDTLELMVYAKTNAVTASGIIPGGDDLWKAPGIYSLVFSRVQHLLDKQSPWYTCETAPKELGVRPYEIEPICVSAKDTKPSSAGE